VPRDPEPGGKQQCDEAGMPDCQSGAVHSVVCSNIIYGAVAGDIGVCHESSCRKAKCYEGCNSVRRRLAQDSARRIDCCRGSEIGGVVWRTRAMI
jgi:hypothetical protein